MYRMKNPIPLIYGRLISRHLSSFNYKNAPAVGQLKEEYLRVYGSMSYKLSLCVFYSHDIQHPIIYRAILLRCLQYTCIDAGQWDTMKAFILFVIPYSVEWRHQTFTTSHLTFNTIHTNGNTAQYLFSMDNFPQILKIDTPWLAREHAIACKNIKTAVSIWVLTLTECIMCKSYSQYRKWFFCNIMSGQHALTQSVALTHKPRTKLPQFCRRFKMPFVKKSFVIRLNSLPAIIQHWPK